MDDARASDEWGIMMFRYTPLWDNAAGGEGDAEEEKEVEEEA